MTHILSVRLEGIPCQVEYEYTPPSLGESANVKLIRMLDRRGKDAPWLRAKFNSLPRRKQEEFLDDIRERVTQ